jgi:hypothetical protein
LPPPARPVPNVGIATRAAPGGEASVDLPSAGGRSADDRRM